MLKRRKRVKVLAKSSFSKATVRTSLGVLINDRENKMKYMITLIFIVFFFGCAGSPMAISMKSPEQLKSIPDEQLCSAYASYKNKNITNEIYNRELFTEKEWQAIGYKSVFVGMSKNAMLAARPNIYLTGISKVGDYGMCEIYTQLASQVNVYIYVRNEKVIGYNLW